MENKINIQATRIYKSLLIASGEARGSTGCSTNNCGDIGAGREDGARPHFGTDILGDEGDWVIAGRDGVVYKTTTQADKSIMDGINLKTNSGYIQTLYASLNVKEKTEVSQGDIIGTVSDLKDGYSGVVNHSHVELFGDYNSDLLYKYSNGLIKAKSQKDNYQDSNQILAPNRTNPFGLSNVTDYKQTQQDNLQKLLNIQNDNLKILSNIQITNRP